MGLWRKKNEKGFAGDWAYRIADLFECGVEFRGRTVLDAGCNMGILAYEISKHAPKSIHGIDRSEAYIRTARMIFLGVAAESRFERLDMLSEKALAAELLPGYDVVLFLSVYHQIRAANGAEAANRVIRTLLARCREDFILRVPEEDRSAVDAITTGEGFVRTFTGDPRQPVDLPRDKPGTSRLYVYRRQS